MLARRRYLIFICSYLFLILASNLVLYCYFEDIDCFAFLKSDELQIAMTSGPRDWSLSATSVQKVRSDNVQVSERRRDQSGPDPNANVNLKNVVGFDSPKLSESNPHETESINIDKIINGKKFPLTYFSAQSSHSPARLRERIKTFPPDSEIVAFLKSQDERMEFEKEYCSRRPYLMQPQTGSSFVADTEYSITFCPIYKSASSSWLVNLLTMKGIPRHNVKGKLQKEVSQVFQRVKPKQVSQTLKETTKFMVVRHPFHRLISCYRDKFEGAAKFYYYDRYGEKMVSRFRPTVKGISPQQASLMKAAVKKIVKLEASHRTTFELDANPFGDPIGPTFEEFTKYVVAFQQDDEHWKPFYIHCSLCHVEYDFVLRFENLYSDSKLFVEYLNMTKVIKTGKENPTSDGTTTDGVVCDYFNQINMDLFRKIISKYQIDFELFHYDTEGYEKCVKDYNSL